MSLARLNDVALLLTLVALAGVLSAALVLQFAGGELPCMLCLQQRVTMFGVAGAIALHFRRGPDPRTLGVALLWASLQLVIGIRQVLLNIYPRPGHAYPGGAMLGLHLPVWSVVIAVALIGSFAFELVLFGGGLQAAGPAGRGNSAAKARPEGRIARIGRALGWYLLALCVVNLGSAVLQCGLGSCHTTGYKLLMDG